jgi:predicted Co/Zn/Cd cation transporter (cation efflux family)
MHLIISQLLANAGPTTAQAAEGTPVSDAIFTALGITLITVVVSYAVAALIQCLFSGIRRLTKPR